MRKSDFTLPALDDLFSTQAERDDAKLERVRNIPLAELHPLKGHPFKVQNNEEMQRMIESIHKVGAITPALARPLPDGGYELISGHRRLAACQVLGVETMPVIVRELSDDEAVIAMVDANLQRETILPSEKAFAYKMKLDALNHQGITSGQVGQKWSREKMADEALDSGRQIQRYIRLTYLIPELLSMVDDGKIAVDNGAAPGSYWLAASQAYRLMELAQESLAGRTAILHMSALSQAELCGAMEVSPFSLELDELQKRKALLSPATPNEIYQRIWDGALPGHRSGKYKDRDVFYSSYIQTYIDRDVTTDIPGVDKVMFADFIRAAACRSGQMLNLHDIAGDVGVSDDTAKRWMKELEKSGIVFFLHPYSNNLLKRTIKTPKMYFFDTGLVSYLTRYSSPEILMNGAINGAILENYVVSEIIKTYSNSAKDCLLHYYRDKNSNEIDLIMESDGQLHPIEIKKSINPPTQITGAFKLLDKASVPRGTGAIICLRETLSAIDSSTYIVPVWMI